MPELPEVETIKRGLAEVLPGKKIASFRVSLPKMYQPSPKAPKRLTGRTVRSVNRRGKVLLLGLDRDLTLLIHLKMTGQLIFREPARIKGAKASKVVLAGGHPIPAIGPDQMVLPGKVTHATLTFDDGSQLFYNDLRQFGYLKLYRNEELADVPILKTF